jgi:protein-disulfide isomerase
LRNLVCPLRAFVRISLTIGLVCAVAAIAPSAFAQQRAVSKAKATANPASSGLINWSLGPIGAPVTVVEYGSLTCSHCAAFNNEILPTIKRRYIDTGQVRYILRPLPTPPFELSVAMHALTLCAGPSRYYPLVEAFFERQQEVFNAAMGETGPKGTIFAIAEDVGGLSYSAAETCLRDPARQAQVRANAEAGAAIGVLGTPTFFVNGTMLTVPVGQTLNETSLSNAIDAALRSRTNAPRPAPKVKIR